MIALAKIGAEEKAPAAVRLTALAALPDGLAKVEPPLFDFLRDRLKIASGDQARPRCRNAIPCQTQSKQLLALAQIAEDDRPDGSGPPVWKRSRNRAMRRWAKLCLRR